MSGVQGVVLAVSVVLVGATALHAQSIVPSFASHPRKTQYEPGLVCDDADVSAVQSELAALDRLIDAHFHNSESSPYMLPDDHVADLSARAAEIRAFVNHCLFDD